MGRKKKIDELNEELRVSNGKRLKDCLKELGMTQIELANKIGYSKEYISRIATGTNEMKTSLAKQISNALTDYASKTKYKIPTMYGLGDNACFGEGESWIFNYRYLMGLSDNKIVSKEALALDEYMIKQHQLGNSVDSLQYIIEEIGYKIDNPTTAPKSLFNDINTMFEKWGFSFDVNDRHKITRKKDGKTIELSPIEALALYKGFISAIQCVIEQKFLEKQIEEKVASLDNKEVILSVQVKDI
jgi:transcriptional regulator with XRE-family HTH domain